MALLIRSKDMQLADFERTGFIEGYVLSIAYAHSLYVRGSPRGIVIGNVLSTSGTRSQRGLVDFEAVLKQMT